ncbi:MAG: glucose-6-phosphate dehydrogenase [Anaerolineae bacterium]|nr:glucose-6-phosphate dehydrogenase [Anaerolineae bacterium]
MSESSTPTTMVIFGATGDLTQRKLIPGLFSLFCKGFLPEQFAVVGFSRTEWSSDEFREQMLAGMKALAPEMLNKKAWPDFARHLHYTPGNATKAEDYATLQTFLTELEGGAANRLYYLATAPNFFEPIVTQLGQAGMVAESIEPAVWRRVVIEKPFGHDLASAQALNQIVHNVLDEHQVYRIDHYLAKETVQNLLVFRFANTMFEPIWNRNYIDHVQITVAEAVDVGHRAGYYDQSGVLRDMFQNHLMQLLAFVSMEPPTSLQADAIRDEKVKALRAIRPLSPAEIARHTIRAQYEGYSTADGVAADSQTATYAALELYIDNWRWQGVPFYLRSGKAMCTKTSQIIIQFKEPPHMMFTIPHDQPIPANYLAFCLQPHEGFHQRIELKEPGREVKLRSIDMDFHYEEVFHPDHVPEAYETLLHNALDGDATLFTRGDGIEAAWQVIDPILDAWQSAAAPPLTTYKPGSWGPAAADELLGKNRRRWRHGCLDEATEGK